MTTSIKKTTAEKYTRFLHYYKNILGFAGWQVQFSDQVDESDDFAIVHACIFEKIIKVKLYSGFQGLPEDKQKNVLFHELVHARVLVMKQHFDQATRFFEEDLVNDLVRGFEEISHFKWQDAKPKNRNT